MGEESKTTTVGTKVPEELAEEIELVAEAEGKTKSEWLREVVQSEVRERSEELTKEDLLRVLLRRQEENIEVQETDDGGVEAYLPGGEKDPLPLGALNRALSDDE